MGIPMHIVILYQHYLAKGQPGHSRVNEYARTWADEDHKVSVITGQAPYMTGRKPPEYRRRLCVHEKDGPVDVYRAYVPDRANRSFLRRAFSYFAFALSSTLAFRKLNQPDVLLVSSPPLTIGLGALLIKRLSKVPMVFEVRDLWPESAVTTGVLGPGLAAKTLYRLEKACYNAASIVTVLTPAFKNSITERGLKPADHVVHIPCGVNTEEMRPEAYSKDIRARMNWNDKKVVLYTGAIGRANRIGQLVETAKLLKKRDDILLAIVGDGMERPEIEAMIARDRLANIVVHGPMPKDEMAAVTASADICTAVLMKNDTFKTVYPNKVFDYMACGKPVVLAIDGLIRELVESEDAGVFAEPENPEAIASAVTRLVDNPDLAAEMGTKGRTFTVDRFDRRRMAMEYLETLNIVIRNRRPQSSTEQP